MIKKTSVSGVSGIPLVYSYSRISSGKQIEGHGMQRQADYAEKWAAKRGLTLDTALILKDEGLSAYHQKHIQNGALGAFLRAVQEGRVPSGSVLIVESLDRLSRATALEAQGQLALIVNAGITVVTMKDEKEYSREALAADPTQLIMSLLIMIRAHEESHTKSKRVLAAFRKQCEGWAAGTYRGIIRVGSDPAWLRHNGSAWEVVPERAEAARLAVARYCEGWGVNRIADELAARELPGIGPNLVARLVKQRALIGEKEVSVDGSTFLLADYYPPLITREQWDELQTVSTGRKGTRDRCEVPAVLTGSGTLRCAYCDSCMTVQNLMSRPRLPDGRMSDFARRLRCWSNGGNLDARKIKCAAGGGGCSAAPFERALMSYCSDMMNLRSLYEGDRTAGPKVRLAEARAALADTDAKLERLLDAIMTMGQPPASFAAKARALEDEKATHQQTIEQCERDLSQAARVHIDGADEQWRALAEGVEAQEYDARMKARKLVADTFERISLEWKIDAHGYMGMVLRAKGGVTRVLRIDKAGKWIAVEDIDSVPELQAA